MNKSYLLIIIISILIINCKQNEEENKTEGKEDMNNYMYMLKRNYIKYKIDNKYKYGLYFDDTNNEHDYKEYIVNLYLQILKSNEIKYENKHFYYPIEKTLNFIQSKSKLYKLLRKFPKGGNLHLHEYQELDRSKLIDLLIDSVDFADLYICDQVDSINNNSSCENSKYSLNYFKNAPPSGWTRLNETKLKKDEIIQKTTLIGLLNGSNLTLQPIDSELRWNLTEGSGIFFTYQNVSEYKNNRYRYLKATLDAALDENVQLLEFRRFLFGTVWYYSSNGTRLYVSPEDELDELIKFKNQYKTDNPELIDFSFIIIGMRSLSKNEIAKQVESTIELNKKYSNLVRGFDLVQEEDKGHTLLYHSESLIKAHNYGKYYSNDTFKLYLHNAETSWAEDEPLKQLSDDVSTLENIYDALTLESFRVGHGLGYLKHPTLYKHLRDNQIAIELCLSSNQILGKNKVFLVLRRKITIFEIFFCYYQGYTPDLRNHPGINFYRSGIPVVLSGDDPGTFGYNELTVEFYLAFLSWDLNLYDLKQLALNSIKYSSLTSDEKIKAEIKWSYELNKFIEFNYEIACEQASNWTLLSIDNILPSYSLYNMKTTLTVYGSGFESALCKRIICKFGDHYQTNGVLVSINEILCQSPITDRPQNDLKFSILIQHNYKIGNDTDSVKHEQEIMTNFKFNLINDPVLYEAHEKYYRLQSVSNFNRFNLKLIIYLWIVYLIL